MPKKKRKHANPNFTTSLNCNTNHYWFDGTEEFSVEIGPILAAAGIVGLAFGFEVNIYPRLFLVFSLFLKINTGDVVKFDNAGGTVEEISLRKTTLET
jgi:small-conductance mechanosensitive channel